ELNLNSDLSTGCGRVSMVRFAGRTPQAPQVLGRNLRFPDGVTVVDSSQLRADFTTLPPASEPDPSTCSGGGWRFYRKAGNRSACTPPPAPLSEFPEPTQSLSPPRAA